MGRQFIDKIRSVSIEGRAKGQLWYASYFAMMIAVLFNPMEDKRNSVIQFKRMIGQGIMQNVDVARRTSNFSCWFMLFIVTFVTSYIFLGYLLSRKRAEEEKKVLDFLDQFLVIANINAVLTGINYFQNKSENTKTFQYTSQLIFVIVCAALLYVILRLGRFMTSDGYATLLVAVFSLGYGITAIINQKWDDGKLLFCVQLILFGIAVIGMVTIQRILKLHQENNFLQIFAIICSFIPFVTSFYIELIHILNQWGIYVVRVRRYYIVSLALMMLTAITCSVVTGRKKCNMIPWKIISYPVLIFGISCLVVQIPLEQQYGAEMYETANYSVLISDFLKYGKIPIIEHYGGHMMTGVWEGIAYAVLNHDGNGAIFSPYMVYIKPVLAVLFFCLVKELWNEDMALATVLFLPFYDSWSYYGLGMVVCLIAIVFVKKNTYMKAFGLWISVIWCALYRLDLGAAFGVAVVLTMLFYVTQSKNWKAARQLLISFGICVGIGIAAWCILCQGRGINAFDRLTEFLLISFSNANWAYDNIGSVGNMSYSWCYMFLPFLCAVCLVFTVFSKKIKQTASVEQWIILLIMGFSYFANYSRGLVRHSLAETSTLIVIVWSGYIFLAAFFSCYRNDKRVFIITFMTMVVVSSLLMWNANFEEKSLLDKEVAVTGDFTDSWKYGMTEDEPKTYWQELEEQGEPVERMYWNEETEEQIKPYRIILNALLEDDETFVDFMNKTFLYSALGRETPCYVSQSPMQLAGERTQEMFIKEMEGVPIVLMPLENNEYDKSDSLDGVPNTYRYYKVAEYIYQHYVPLCRYSNKFAIWCLPQRYEEMEQKVEELASQTMDEGSAEITESIYKISYGYDGPNLNEEAIYIYTGVFHNISVSYLPLIWAECDDKRADQNPVAAKVTADGSNLFVIDRKDFIPDENGNYLRIHISSDCDAEDVVITIGKSDKGEFEERYRYQITVSEGVHDYLIRVSTDYYWYTDSVNAISVQSDAELSDVSMSILAGD